MKNNLHSESSEENGQSLIVKRTNLFFNEKECQVLNFTEITAYKRLEQERETNKLLKTLNASVHHEMLTPLKANVEMAERLYRCLHSFPHEKKLAQTISYTSRLLLLHANDLLDHRIIEKGGFMPDYDSGSVTEAILEIVKI